MDRPNQPPGDQKTETEKTPKMAWNGIFDDIIPKDIQASDFALGPMNTHSMLVDPKHCCFVLSRYKFVAKMLEGRASALEIGCGDSFGTPIVAQHVKQIHCIDWDDRFISDNRQRLKQFNNITYEELDINLQATTQCFDAAYCIDVIEHLEPASEKKFFENICHSLSPQSVLIVGTPNITASQYASPQSNAAHINLHSHATLKKLLDNYFYNTFMMSMNDEVLHTGFSPMAHYIWAIAVGLKPEYQKTIQSSSN